MDGNRNGFWAIQYVAYTLNFSVTLHIFTHEWVKSNIKSSAFG